MKIKKLEEKLTDYLASQVHDGKEGEDFNYRRIGWIIDYLSFLAWMEKENQDETTN